VEDLVQEVFLSALRQLHALRDVSRFGAWLAAITRNRANDHYRKSGPEAALTEPVAEDQADNCVKDHAAEHLILRLVEGMTGPEIAARTGLKHGSVRVNLCRGMQLLREKLEERTRDAS
jgi:RNA polymerase sigma-70 factor (ECF subfamily)